MMAFDNGLRREVGELLRRLGYGDESLEDAFYDWICVENLEARYVGFERLDPVVLDHLRKMARLN